MREKDALPPIDAELEPPRKRVDLKAIRPKEAPDEAIEENSRKLGNEWGASTSLTASAPPEPEAVPLASLRIEVPAYLDDELTKAAAEKRVTKQFLVLTALRRAGYHIRDTDIVADKRKARRKG